MSWVFFVYAVCTIKVNGDKLVLDTIDFDYMDKNSWNFTEQQ